MDLNEHISKYLVGNSARDSDGDPLESLRKLVDFFKDVPLTFMKPKEEEEFDDDQDIANGFLEEIGYGEALFTAIDDVPDYNLFLNDNMTEEQADALAASRTARLVIELGPDDDRPRLDLILKPETDEFHTVWGAHHYEDEGKEEEHDASWLGLFYEVGGEDRYLEIHFCPWLA